MTALRALLIAVVALMMLPSAGARALQPDELLSDPKLETRARGISAGLRCLVCQNQSIDDSDAPLARDLRVLVRDRLKAGDTDAAVRQFVVSRYGDFVLLKPPFGLHTALLWGGPFVVLILGATALVLARRRRRAPVTALSAEERQALGRLLDG